MFATEIFAVQNALGFLNKSMTYAIFKQLDSQYKADGRLQDLTADCEGSKIRAILVDGKLIKFYCDGQEMEADQAEIMPLFS